MYCKLFLNFAEDLESIIEPVVPFGCLPPVVPSNGETRPTMQIWNSGDVVFYFCNDNFTLEGSTNATCQANGQFNQPVPECVGMLDYSAAVAYFFVSRFLQFFFFV